MMPSLPFRRLALLALVAACGLPACAYTQHRLLDLTDVVDLKYGVALGVGAKVEATTYLGTGAGLAGLGYIREWYGRKSFETEGCAFAHIGILGADGGAHGCARDRKRDSWTSDRYEVYFLITNLAALEDHGSYLGNRADESDQPPETFPPPPFLSRMRFGGEVIVPLGFEFGIYLNVGELADFVAGLVGFDPVGDDGEGKGELYELPPPESHAIEKNATPEA